MLQTPERGERSEWEGGAPGSLRVTCLFSLSPGPLRVLQVLPKLPFQRSDCAVLSSRRGLPDPYPLEEGPSTVTLWAFIFFIPPFFIVFFSFSFLEIPLDSVVQPSRAWMSRLPAIQRWSRCWSAFPCGFCNAIRPKRIQSYISVSLNSTVVPMMLKAKWRGFKAAHAVLITAFLPKGVINSRFQKTLTHTHMESQTSWKVGALQFPPTFTKTSVLFLETITIRLSGVLQSFLSLFVERCLHPHQIINTDEILLQRNGLFHWSVLE